MALGTLVEQSLYIFTIRIIKITVSQMSDCIQIMRCMTMKAYVNKETCIACGLCVATCPEIFSFDEDGMAEAVGQISDELYVSAESARNACPVEAIDIKEE